MHREELEADEQPNVLKKLNTNILMISMQYNSCYVPIQEAFQVIPPTIFSTCSKSEVKKLSLAFTVDRWASMQTLFWTSSKTSLSSSYQNLISVPSYPILL